MTDGENEDFVHTLYNRVIRPYLPYKIGVHNGVAVKGAVKLFDFRDRFPDYESALVSAIRTQVQEGDSVIIVGGGLGVSTVAAAEATRRDGKVETYEGSAEQYRIVKNTTSLNKVEGCTNTNHAIVGSFLDHSRDSYGEPENAEIVNPSTLSNPDVLVLDCEGAELEILSNLSSNPDTVIVETHGFLDSPEKDVREILSEKGYDVVDRGIELESKGVYVLTALHQ